MGLPFYWAATLCNVGLEWTNQKTNEPGYSLAQAKEKTLLAPALPENCSLNQFNGAVSGELGRVQNWSFQLRGDTCEKWVATFQTTPLVFSFKFVPAENGSKVWPIVRTTVEELPAANEP